MRWLCVCSFIVLSYHAVVSSEADCDASRNVTGVVGGEVTLYVDHTEIDSISWVRGKELKPIAETKPGSVIEDVISSYRGRLKATRNGSLVITHLTREDQGSYKARVQSSSHRSQRYHLSVYDKQYNRTGNNTKSSHNSISVFSDKRYNSTLNDPKSSHNSSSEFLDVMSDTPCVVRSLSSVEGEEVLLKVDLADLSEVSWVTRPGNYHIARTYIGGKIYIRGNNYKGRLFGESDGSLRISNLSRDDQGLYRANQRGPESLQCLEYYLQVYKQVSEDDLQIFYSVSRHEGCSVNITCAVQRSDLTVTWISSEGDIIVNGNVISIHDPSRNATYTCTAGNPSNNRSISVNPWSQCDKGRRHTRNRADYTWNNIGRLILSGCILVLTCCFFTCHLKTERNIKP